MSEHFPTACISINLLKNFTVTLWLDTQSYDQGVFEGTLLSNIQCVIMYVDRQMSIISLLSLHRELPHHNMCYA